MIPRSLKAVCLRPTLLASALVVAGWFIPATARANAVSQTLAFHLDSTSASEALAFAPSDPLQGSLTSVLITFSNVTLTHNWWLWNNGERATPVAYSASLTGASLTIGDSADSTVVSFDPLAYGGVTPTSLASVSLLTYLSELGALVGGTPPPASDAFHGTGSTLPVSGLLPLFDFGGGLPIAFDPGVWTSYDSGTWDVMADNFYTASFVAVDGNATVTYTYGPLAVADSAPGLAAVAAWLVLGLVARLRRREQISG